MSQPNPQLWVALCARHNVSDPKLSLFSSNIAVWPSFAAVTEADACAAADRDAQHAMTNETMAGHDGTHDGFVTRAESI